MSTSRRSALAALGGWFALLGRATQANAAPEPARKVTVSLKITDYAEKPGAYRWDAETLIGGRNGAEPTKATTWGYREIGILGLLRASDPVSGYSMVFENGPSPCSDWSIKVTDPAGSEVFAACFVFDGTPPVWPRVGAA